MAFTKYSMVLKKCVTILCNFENYMNKLCFLTMQFVCYIYTLGRVIPTDLLPYRRQTDINVWYIFILIVQTEYFEFSLQA